MDSPSWSPPVWPQQGGQTLHNWIAFSVPRTPPAFPPKTNAGQDRSTIHLHYPRPRAPSRQPTRSLDPQNQSFGPAVFTLDVVAASSSRHLGLRRPRPARGRTSGSPLTEPVGVFSSPECNSSVVAGPSDRSLLKEQRPGAATLVHSFLPLPQKALTPGEMFLTLGLRRSCRVRR
jgi:hypothetical protein